MAGCSELVTRTKKPAPNPRTRIKVRLYSARTRTRPTRTRTRTRLFSSLAIQIEREHERGKPSTAFEADSLFLVVRVKIWSVGIMARKNRPVLRIFSPRLYYRSPISFSFFLPFFNTLLFLLLSFFLARRFPAPFFSVPNIFRTFFHQKYITRSAILIGRLTVNVTTDGLAQSSH